MDRTTGFNLSCNIKRTCSGKNALSPPPSLGWVSPPPAARVGVRPPPIPKKHGSNRYSYPKAPVPVTALMAGQCPSSQPVVLHLPTTARRRFDQTGWTPRRLVHDA